MLIHGFNKRATDFVDFDKPPGTAPGGIPDTFVLANLKDGGHTLVLILSSCGSGCLALRIQGRFDLLFDEMAQLSPYQML